MAKKLVRWSKKFKPHVPGERQALQALGKRALALIRHRIEKRGLDAGGSPLPEVDPDGGWFAVGQGNKARYADLPLVPHNREGGRGPNQPHNLVYRDGYRALKRKLGRGIKRGQSLTGKMWASGVIAVSSKGKDTRIIRVSFSGSEKTGKSATKTTATGKAATTSIRHRDKAWLAQFAHRKSDTEGQGAPEFYIMAISDAELQQLAAAYLARLELFAG